MDFMNVVLTIIALYVVVEFCTIGYVLYNRKTVVPRLQRAVRSFLGLDVDFNYHANNDSRFAEELRVVHKKINYVAGHVKFERQQLRKMGILKDPPAPTAQPEERDATNVISFPQR